MNGEKFLNEKVTLYHGDSREVLKALPDNSIDSVVTDPPYALVSIAKRLSGANAAPAKDGDVYARASAGFMGKQWDTGETAFAVEFWAEVMRVLKPGGHVVAASGTRTYHRLAVAIEDAGFEIRDQILWLYGSGFPKSHDVSKGIDRAMGAEPVVTGVAGKSGTKEIGTVGHVGGEYMATRAASPQAAQWQGWGTALKPATEPWVLARKPLIGTVAANVLEHGTGAINIDGCRVSTEGEKITPNIRDPSNSHEGWVRPWMSDKAKVASGQERAYAAMQEKGRWPANVIHDGSDEVVAGFPETSGGNGEPRALIKGVSGSDRNGNASATYGAESRPAGAYAGLDRNDSGSAARFFYSAKADALDRAGSKHPTVKPVDLMQYLCRLVTPPGGVILDPFAGSGTTGEAAWREGFQCVLIEREEEYAEDIRERLRLSDQGIGTKKRAIAKKKDKGESIGGLFG